MSSPTAIIPLAKGATLSLSAIQQSFVSAWPRLPRPMQAKRNEHTLSFCVGGSTVTFELKAGPVRSSEFETICRDSWLWPEASRILADHRGHVVVSVDSKETSLNQVKFLSLAITALLMTCPSALGVYWCAGSLVVSAEMFREFCVRMLPDSLPLYIWIDFRVSRQESGRSGGHTRGLFQFGLMDIETLNAREAPDPLRERLFGLAVYLIENGLIIKNGDTIDEDERETIKVVYGDSAFGNPRRIMRLDYGAPAKAARRR